MPIQTTLTMDKILGSSNLADLLSPEDLNYIGEEVCEGYEEDKDSRKQWENNIKEWYDLALQVAEEKTFPWVGAANVKYPLITIAALQFNARAYPALIPGTKPIRGRVIGKDVDGSKVERAIRVAKHMSYQILEQMPDWEEEMDKLLFALPIVGCMFKKTYYDTVLQRNVSEVVYPKELVVDYWAKTLDTADRITHVLALRENEIYEKVESEVFRDCEYKRAAG